MQFKFFNFFGLKFLAILLTIVLLAAGCGGAKQPKLNATITVWQPFTETKAMDGIIKDFQAQFKGAKVVLVDKDIKTYEQDLIDALAAGRGPDIFFINNSWLPQYLDKITPAAESKWRFVDFRDTFVGTVTDDFTRGTTIYGAPLSVDTLALYYNSALLADGGVYTPPTTWGEFQAAVRKVRRQNSQGYFTRSGAALGHSSRTGGGQINRGEDILYLISMQLGGKGFLSDGSAAVFGDSIQRKGKSVVPMVAAMDFYTSFARADQENYTWNKESDYSIDSFVNGRSAMLLGYSYVAEIIKQKNSRLEFGVAPAPQESVNVPAVHFANYWAGVVSRQSQFSDVAWSFLQFATSKDQMEKYVTKTKLPASRKDLLSAQENDPNLSVFARQAALAKSFFRPHADEIDAIFSKAIDSVVFSGASAQEAVVYALRQTSAILKRRN